MSEWSEVGERSMALSKIERSDDVIYTLNPNEYLQHYSKTIDDGQKRRRQ